MPYDPRDFQEQPIERKRKDYVPPVEEDRYQENEFDAAYDNIPDSDPSFDY